MPEFSGMVAIVVRVGTPGAAAFQLRKGEEGLSVFDPNSVDPPLSESKLLEPFRDGSYLIVRSIAAIEELGMRVEWIEGDGVLPERLRRSHREIRPGAQMTRTQFKSALKELE